MNSSNNAVNLQKYLFYHGRHWNALLSKESLIALITTNNIDAHLNLNCIFSFHLRLIGKGFKNDAMIIADVISANTTITSIQYYYEFGMLMLLITSFISNLKF